MSRRQFEDRAHVSDDAAIAEALARDDQERLDAELAAKLQLSDEASANARAPVPSRGGFPGVTSSRATSRSNGYPAAAAASASSRGTSFPSSHAASSSSPFPPFAMPAPSAPTHMCYVPCVVGDGICVEMMVDTGAQSSVISVPLARRLNIYDRLDTREWGVASGVGQARIVGKIRNVLVTMGDGVEFDMSFIVLDIEESLLLLGLDQMRKFKCVVNLEKDCLIFGGSGGLEVPFLPPSEKKINLRELPGCEVS